jgi:hypothetical protein
MTTIRINYDQEFPIKPTLPSRFLISKKIGEGSFSKKYF